MDEVEEGMSWDGSGGKDSGLADMRSEAEGRRSAGDRDDACFLKDRAWDGHLG